MHLSPTQKKIFEFIRDYIRKYELSPSYDEIRTHFNYKSFNSVFKHVRQIEAKGFIQVPPNKKRAITLTERETPAVQLKLYGTVAAGEPMDPVECADTFSVPQELLKRGENFCLRVRGDSMVGDGILDGDTIIVNKRESALNNEMVVAMIDNEVTLKRFHQRGGKIELRPSNPALKPIKV
ncbi:MAG: transcriptional repressor LexA, partial [Nitrospinota bacterium]